MPGIETRDLIIVLPGITGTALARSIPAGATTDLWAPSGQAIWEAVKSLGGSLHELAVPVHDPISDSPQSSIVPTKVVRGLHGVLGLGKIDGYADLAQTILDEFTIAEEQGFEWFPYDWRLSNRHSARRLADFVTPRLEAWRKTHGADARVVFVAHSMGGLVARYFLEVLDGGYWRDCRALFTFGTPYRGSLNAVNFIANGYKQLFIDLTEVLRSCPSVYELLPTYRAIQIGGQWKHIEECGALPHMNTTYVKAAAKFHDDIEQAVEAHRKGAAYRDNGYLIRPFVGIGQTTLQSAVFGGGALTCSTRLPEWAPPVADGGDGTVPGASAVPIELSNVGLESYVGERHGSLQNNEYVLDDFRERLKTVQAGGFDEFRGITAVMHRPTIDLQVDDCYVPDEPVTICGRVSDGGELAGGLVAEVTPSNGAAQAYPMRESDARWHLTLDGIPPGLYRVRVRGAKGGGGAPTPVRELFEVVGR